MILFNLEFSTADDGTIDLCKKYWELTPDLKFVHKVADLAKEFGIKPTRLPTFVAESCIVVSTDIICENCGKAYRFTNRSDFTARRFYGITKLTCDECQERESLRLADERAAREEQKRVEIRARFGSPKRGPTRPNDLSLAHAVYLLSVFRVGAIEDLRYIRSLSSFALGSLSPRQEFDSEIFEELFENQLLFIHPESPIEAFNEDLTRFAVPSVLWWTPLLSITGHPGDFFVELESIFRHQEWGPDWNQQWRPLWKRIAIEECLQYLIWTLSLTMRSTVLGQSV